MFKLTRIDRIETTKELVKRKDVPMPDLSVDRMFSGAVHVKAVFQPQMRWHLLEEFGKKSFREQDDGTLLFECDYSDEDYLISWLLTCKDQVEVLEPVGIRQRLYEIANHLIEKYEQGKGEETWQDPKTEKSR